MEPIRKLTRKEILNKLHNESLENLVRNEVDVEFFSRKMKLFDKKTTEYAEAENSVKLHKSYIYNTALTLDAIKKLEDKENSKLPNAPTELPTTQG